MASGSAKKASDNVTVVPKRKSFFAWDVKPKDYILYCVRYINPWHSSYLRRGIDLITEDGKTESNIRHKEYVEYDEVVYLTTKSLNQAVFPVSTVVPDGESVKTLTCNMVLTFNGDECTISSDTPGITAPSIGVPESILSAPMALTIRKGIT